MDFRLHSRIRAVLLALGLLAGFAVPASTAPLAGLGRAAVTPSTGVEQVRYNCYRGNCRRYWNDDWRYRRHYRPYVRRPVYSGFYFGLGVPAYRYYAPPRRYYRSGGSAHVAWCYDRYRSYRAWDNTYQPYHGPRRQCWSPYS